MWVRFPPGTWLATQVWELISDQRLIYQLSSRIVKIRQVVLLVETLENTDVYTPTISRLAALTLIDILATSVVIRRGKEHNFRVAEMKRHLAAMRGSL